MTPSRSRPGLTGLTYQILLALSQGERHGYAILKEMEERGGPDAVPSTGALYLALRRMEADGTIEEVSPPPRPDTDARRRYYAITDSGRAVARTESARLARLVDAARERALLPEPAPARDP